MYSRFSGLIWISFSLITGVYPGFTQMEWYSKIYPSLNEDVAPMECVQEAGEILYLVNTGYHLISHRGII